MDGLLLFFFLSEIDPEAKQISRTQSQDHSTRPNGKQLLIDR